LTNGVTINIFAATIVETINLAYQRNTIVQPQVDIIIELLEEDAIDFAQLAMTLADILNNVRMAMAMAGQLQTIMTVEIHDDINSSTYNNIFKSKDNLKENPLDTLYIDSMFPDMFKPANIEHTYKLDLYESDIFI